jgi:hypothetical protein
MTCDAGFIKARQVFHEDPLVLSLVGLEEAVEVHVRKAAGDGLEITRQRPSVGSLTHLG